MLKRILLSTIFTLSLYSKHASQNQVEGTYNPNFAGTLLAYFAENIPPGQCLIEPYVFVDNFNGLYNSHWKTQTKTHFFNIQLLNIIETGITPWLDIALITNGEYSLSHGKKSYLYGDTHLSLGFQLTKNQLHTWTPDIRFVLLQNFPTGKYQHLNPKKFGADISGTGAYETWLIAVTRKVIYFTPRQPITVNFSLECNFPTSVHVKGYNLYGGIPTTNGSVKPGQQTIANLGLEYSLTLNWILGLDIHYQHQNKSRSHHTAHSPLGRPSSENYSLAPCIEYNPTPTFGFELGSWFTIAGRNSPSFTSAVTTIYWEF